MYYKYNDYNLYYEKHGDKKKVIIILPGWGDTRKTFYNLINTLKEDFTIYIIDYPGFGNSPNISKELNIYDYSDIIYDFICKNNINKPIILAHSFGGRITSILLEKYHLNVNKVILMDVAGIKRLNIKVLIKQKIYKFLKRLTHFLPKYQRYKIRKKLLKIFSSTDYKSLPPTMYKTFKNIINEDLRKYYKKISCKVLIIWGEKDDSTPLKDAYYLNKKIKKSSLFILKESAHFPYIDNEEKVIKRIKSYIEKEDFN